MLFTSRLRKYSTYLARGDQLSSETSRFYVEKLNSCDWSPHSRKRLFIFEQAQSHPVYECVKHRELYASTAYLDLLSVFSPFFLPFIDLRL